MKLYLTRHTQTNYNVLQLCNADPSVDVHLTELGIEQAKQLAKAIESVPFEVIIISELPRTRQTANIINQNHQKPIVVDKKLNDITTYEGRPVTEYRAAREASGDLWGYKAEGDESYQDVWDRAGVFLEEIGQRQERSVLIISHQAVLATIIGNLEKLSPEQVFSVDIQQGEYREYDI